MPQYPKHRRGFDIDSAAAVAQRITIDDKWKGHAVTGGATPDTVKLAGDGDEVWGSIEYFDSGQVVVADMGEDITFKNAGTTALAIGDKIVGAVRQVSGANVSGYVKAFPNPLSAAPSQSNVNAAFTAALKAKGTVVDGGSTSTSNQDVSADVKVAFSRCA